MVNGSQKEGFILVFLCTEPIILMIGNYWNDGQQLMFYGAVPIMLLISICPGILTM